MTTVGIGGQESQRFTDRGAVVTGGGSGIGRATCERLAAEGARVACLDLDLGAAESTAESIRSAGGSAQAYQCDVTSEDSVERAMAAAERDLGPVKVVVANAGIAGPVAQIPDIEVEAWNQLIAVNLTGVFLTAKHGIPLLRRAGGGAIVVTASNASIDIEPNWGAYAASKGGALMLTKGLGIDHAAEGIRVNCVCPGPIDTPLLRGGYADELGEAIVKDLSAPLPVPAGRPAEVAAAIAFLASDDAALVNASALIADGGSTSRMGSGFAKQLAGI